MEPTSPLPPDLLAGLAEYPQAERAALTWEAVEARPEQLPPAGDWQTWYLRGARGSGKTRAAAEWLAHEIATAPDADYGLVAPTLSDVVATCVEGESGLFPALQRYGVPHRWADKTVGHIAIGERGNIFSGGADKGALRLQGHNLRATWCIAGDEPVWTRRGLVPIRSVRVGDEAMTRAGWRRVVAHARTHRSAPVVLLTTASGNSVRCTAEHQVWVEGRGWTEVRALTVGDTLRLWNSPPAPLPGTSGTARAGIATGSGTTRTTSACSCIPASGSPFTAGASLTTGSCITSTTIAGTTSRAICSRCRVPITSESTDFSGRRRRRQQSARFRSGNDDRGPNASRARVSARSVAAVTDRLASGRSSAGTSAETGSTVKAIEPSGWSDVYDITVADAHEFFAGGILVKNCDEVGLWQRTQWERAWRESVQFSTRMGVARIVATGTPKAGHPLVRLLLDDPKVPKSLMRTRDNVAYLSPVWLAKMEATYAGTRLGRQELEGEDITEVEGALWTPALCEAMRVAEAPPRFLRVGVAVDPSGGKKPTNAECGIVVGGLGEDGHVYVVADVSGRLAPRAWGERVCATYHAHAANHVIVETNFGGEIVTAMLDLIDPRVPVVAVNASRGKDIRAEPVVTACERGRVHFVGAFPQLEESLCTWVPGSGDRSPDRMDALVWLVTGLLADANLAGAVPASLPSLAVRRGSRPRF